MKLFFLVLISELFCSFAQGLAVPLKNSSIVVYSDPLGCNRYKSAQLYVFGGKNLDKNTSTDYLFSASQFNSSTGDWDSANDISIARDTSCGAVVGTKIYLFGGYNGTRQLKTAEVYDCETGTYSEFRALSRSSPRSGCGAAVLNGFIYVAGGYDGAKRSSVIRYNIQTTRRENVTPMHTGRTGLQLIELGGRLYAIGGGTNVVEIYNANTGRWTEVANTQYAHNFFGAAVHEGKIYARSHLGFEVYSPELDQWKTLPQLNILEGSSLVSMNGRLWALGGGSRTDYKGTKSVFMFNTMTNTWNKQMDMDVARMFHSSFVVYH